MNKPGPARPRSLWTDAFREFDALYEAAPARRAERLQVLREDAPGLADAVQRLLAEHDGRAASPGWLDELPAALPPGPAPEPPAPERIGPWRLLRELGRGGTARVWLAHRDDVPWVREVALKVPLAGLLREDLRERLVRERDILSRLEHPHIARLYDAGFSDAQPWLALEYVQGQDILAWCDARRAPLRQRVRLFRQVLQAVQYAHAALIVHRDLKPSNILVTGAGEVRLLDFGIAKLMAEGQDHTQTTQLTQAAGRMLTPAYASPEQLRDEPLTTATDIYSLGLVLYQLLTGVQPFAGRPRSASQVEQAILDGHIVLASRAALTEAGAQARGLPLRGLRRALAGDLEAVLCKATLADPAARYGSAAAFDADLEAWLDGRPVRARRPTLWQHTVKLVRRHPWASVAGLVATCALSATTVVAVHQASQAREQAGQARQEAARARATRDFLLGLFDEASPDRNGGRDVLARDLLVRGEHLVDRELAGQPRLQVEMLESIGQVWWKFGDMEQAARVLRHRSAVAAVAAPGPDHANALLDEVQLAGEAGDTRGASERWTQAHALAQREGIAAPGIHARLALEQGWLAIKGRPPALAEALGHLDRARSLAQAAGRPDLEIDVIMAQTAALRRQRRYAEAVQALVQAESLAAGLRDESPTGFPQRKLHALRLEQVRNLWSQGEYRQGWPVADRLMQDVEAWAGTNANHFGLLNYRVLWFGLMVQLGLDEAAARWVQAHPAHYETLPMADPLQAVERYRWLAKLWVARADWPRAAQMLRLGRAVPRIAGTEAEANLLIVEAEAMLRQADPGAALRALEQAERMAATAAGARWSAMLDAGVLRSVAQAQSGAWPQAVGQAREALEGAARTFGDQHPRTARARIHLVWLWLRHPQRHQVPLDAERELSLALPVLQRCYLPASVPVRMAEVLGEAVNAATPGAPPQPALAATGGPIQDLTAFLF